MGLERRIAALEEDARETPGDEDSRVVELRDVMSKFGEEQERHRRHALESSELQAV